MSRILRRPMFRGGRVDSRGTGITSGLMDEPRVEAQQGLFVGMDPRYSGFGTQQPTVTSEDLIRSYTPSGIPQYLQDLYQSNVSQIVDDKRFPTITKEDDDETIISNYPPIDRLAESFNLSAKKDKEDILIPKAKPELKDTGISDLEKDTSDLKKDTSDLEKDDTDINLEDLYADRLKAAKRGDIADILLGISAGALEEGTLTGAAKGAVEAARQASKSEALKDQIKALETQMKIADRAGNIKQKRALEQILFAAKSKQPDFKPSEFEKRTKFLVEQGYSSDTAMRLALKQPATLEEQIQDLTKNSLTGETTPEIFQSAVRMFYMDKYKGELPIESISQDPNGTAVAEVSDGIYSDSANGNVYTVKDKVVTQIRG